MILSESQIDLLNESGEMLVFGFIVLAIMAIALAYDKFVKKLKIKESDSENVIIAKFKWDFFYALFIEGLVDIMVSIAEGIILFAGEESEE